LWLLRAKEGADWQPVASSLRGLSHPSLVYLAPTDGSGEGTLASAYIDAQLGYSVVELNDK
jgi:hypothetical protein